MKDEQKIHHVISEALDNLFAARFMSMHDYKELTDCGQLVQKGKYVDYRVYYNTHPENPLAEENRFRRIDAADTIRDQAAVLQKPLPLELLEKIYPSRLFRVVQDPKLTNYLLVLAFLYFKETFPSLSVIFIFLLHIFVSELSLSAIGYTITSFTERWIALAP